MLLELFSYVNFINAMAFVYAYYIQCLDGPVNCFSLTFCIFLIQVLLLLTVTLQGGGDLISIAYCPFFINTVLVLQLS